MMYRGCSSFRISETMWCKAVHPEAPTHMFLSWYSQATLSCYLWQMTTLLDNDYINKVSLNTLLTQPCTG